MDFPDNNFLLKTLTVVSGPDMVDLTFHNFVSYKENVGKVRRRVCGEVCGTGLGLGTWGSSGFLQDRPGLQGVGASMCGQGGLTAVLWGPAELGRRCAGPRQAPTDGQCLP